jgi:HupE / UreJ protein
MGVLAILAGLSLVWSSTAGAHEIRPAITNVTFDNDGHYTIDLGVNVEAMLSGISPKHRNTNESPNANRYNALRALAPQELRSRVEEFVPQLLDGIHVEFDGVRAMPRFVSVDIPPVGDLAVARESHLILEGDAPSGAKEFRWLYAEAFGPNVLRLKRAEDTQINAVWLKDGEASEIYPLHGAIVSKTRLEVAWQYLGLGFTHIVPKGLDHILFVLGLFLLSTGLRPLLVQVTSFTVAHSITLGLTMYGVVSLSPKIVEPLIAASIVYVAVENLFTSKLHAWRPVVVFCFGLLHGMGFAGVLKEIGLPRSEFITGLVTFNVGVEFGQLTVITLAFLIVGAWRRNPDWYRGRIVVPGSLAIAATGLYWTVQRTIF